MSPACGALLLACAAVWERDALLPGRGLAIAARNPLGFAAALCMGFFVNLTTAYAIQMTSSLTFKARRPPPRARPGGADGAAALPDNRRTACCMRGRAFHRMERSLWKRPAHCPRL
jgi:hypothetical protein